MEQLEVPVARRRAVRQRIRGIDMARALAIIGMVTVHVGPQDRVDGGVLGAAYRAPHGRAAIGFIVLAGIGVSLLAGDRSRSRLDSTVVVLGWRALVLFPAGLALQTLDINVAVILQYYAVYFLVAMAAVRLPDRWLLIVAGLSATLGSSAIIWLERAAPLLFEPGVPRWYDLPRIIRDVLVTGYYPVIVWTAPLLVGMWLGRRDLRSTTVMRTLAGGGAALAAAGFLASDGLVALFGPAASSVDWRRLYVIEPHNGMPLWLLTSTGIAVAVLGACLLLGRVLRRMVWPLVALGQLALTAYVVHLLVLHAWPGWLVRDTFPAAWLSVGRFTVVALLLATAHRALARRGPFELLLRPPVVRAAGDGSVGARPATPVTRRRGRGGSAG